MLSSKYLNLLSFCLFLTYFYKSKCIQCNFSQESIKTSHVIKAVLSKVQKIGDRVFYNNVTTMIVNNLILILSLPTVDLRKEELQINTLQISAWPEFVIPEEYRAL